MGSGLLVLALCLQEDAGSDPHRSVQDLGSEALEVRVRAENTLKNLGSAAEAALREGAGSADPETRGRCERLLVWIDLRKQLPAEWSYDFPPDRIVDGCFDPDPDVRRKSFYAINNAGFHRALPILRRFASDPSADLRRILVKKLVMYGDKTASPLVGRFLDDPDNEVRKAALQALRSWRDGAHDKKVRALLDHPDAEVRAGAVYALRPDKADAVRLILASLDDADARVRAAGLFRLAETGDRAHAPVVLRILADGNLPDASIEAAEKMGIVPPEEEIRKVLDRPLFANLSGEGGLFDLYPRIHDPVLLERLQALLLKDVDVSTQSAIIRLLVRSGVTRTPEPLRDALRSTDPEVRREALYAVDDFPDDDLVPLLTQLLRSAVRHWEIEGAAWALSKRPGGAHAWETIESMVRWGPESPRHGLIRTLFRMDGPRAARALLDVLVRMRPRRMLHHDIYVSWIVEHADPPTREHALREFSDSSGFPEYGLWTGYLKRRPKLTETETYHFLPLVDDRSRGVIITEVLAVGGARAAVPALLERLPSANVAWKTTIALALYDLGSPAEASAVAGLLDSKDPGVLGAALLCLSRIGSKEHVPAIARHLEDGRVLWSTPLVEKHGKRVVLEVAILALERITGERLQGVNVMDTARLWRERLGATDRPR